MTVLSVILVFLIMQYSKAGEMLANMNFATAYEQAVSRYLDRTKISDEIKKTLIILIPVLIMALLLYIVRHHVFLKFLIDIIVLAYGWSYQEKVSILPSSTKEKIQYVFSHPLCEAFGIVFWFIILGPIGVIIYDLVRRLSFISARNILEWPVSRVLGLGYALAGHFSPTFNYWISHFFEMPESNHRYIEECGFLSLFNTTTPEVDFEAHVLYATSLVKRAYVMLFAVLLIFALGALVY